MSSEVTYGFRASVSPSENWRKCLYLPSSFCEHEIEVMYVIHLMYVIHVHLFINIKKGLFSVLKILLLLFFYDSPVMSADVN